MYGYSAYIGVKYMLKQVLDHDSYAVPIPAVQEVLDFLPYASTERVMFQMLYYTGCRCKELDVMTPKLLHENTLYWELGKNQHGTRKEVLPKSYLSELKAYRATHRVCEDRMFGPTAATFRRYFDRDVRPFLSSTWREKRLTVRSKAFSTEYVLQLKGLRKTFQTMLFAKEWQRWGTADVALQFTCKRMQHSSERITAYHYLQNFESLQIDKQSPLIPSQAIKACAQLRVMDF